MFIKTKTESKSIPPVVKFPNESTLAASTSNKAKLLNNFFVSVFSSEPEISTNDHVYHSCTDETIQDFSCIEADVEKLLGLNTNKGCGPDGTTARMLRKSESTIAPSLSKILNISLKLGKLPSEWRLANIMPVFKKGVKETVTNHQPISLTCLVVKVLEKLITKHVSVYVDQHNLLSVHQYGLRTGLSSTSQLIHLFHTWA